MPFVILVLLSGYASISGFVTDASNGEKLSFANVYLEGTEIGAATNEKGYYIIHAVNEGGHTVVFSYVGYEPEYRSVTVLPDSNLSINAELIPSSIEVGEVVVSAERTRFEQEVEVSRITFTKRDIQSVPSLFEKDLIKTLQLMPGVVALHDLSNKLYVRGGSPDENLALLDGITVYNPSSHLFGLFSTFDPDVVSDAQLFAGGFPAMYGDRLSSVLTITTKEGNSKRVAGTASLGLVTSKLMIEGPIPNGSFVLSGRRTYFDALVWAYAKVFDDSVSLPYYFYDGIAKVNYNPSPNNRFTLTGLGGSDVLNFEESVSGASDEKVGVDWGNHGVSLRWRRVFTPTFYGEMVGALSNFNTHFIYEDFEDTLNNFNFYETITDFTGKCDFNLFLNKEHTLDFGIDAKHLRIEYNFDIANLDTTIEKHTPYLLTAYVQDKWFFIPKVLSLQAGIRSIYYSIGKRLRIDPRIGLKYHLGPNSAINVAGGRYSQYLITINNQESYFSIFDFWRPVDSVHAIPTAYHAIVGFEQWIDKDTKFTIEPYYKYYDNLLIPKSLNMFYSEPSESLQLSHGYSMGIDLFFKKSYKNIFGWISYSLGFTRRWDGNRYYAPRYDRRHNLNIILGCQIPHVVPVLRNAKFNVRWYVASGLPYAEDLGRYRVYYGSPRDQFPDYWWATIPGPRDAYRLPLTHRLDAHLEKDFTLFGLKGSWYIDVMNVYDQENIVFYSYEYDEDPPIKDGVALLPIPIPSFGINFRF
ncbi:TonB-dependent receptor [candidate division WOR-3 bacterium]|nr:TonB-dependent receptor [candidate division WOR-3 bacterium]